MLVSLQTLATMYMHCSRKSCSETNLQCSEAHFMKCEKFRCRRFSHPTQQKILVLLNFSVVDLNV